MLPEKLQLYKDSPQASDPTWDQHNRLDHHITVMKGLDEKCDLLNVCKFSNKMSKA